MRFRANVATWCTLISAPTPQTVLAVQLDREPGSAEPAPLDLALAHESTLGQLGHQAGDRGLVEPEVDGEPGPRTGPVVTQAAKDRREIRPPQRHLVGGGELREGLHAGHLATASDCIWM